MAVKPVGCRVTLHRQEPDWPILARMRELGKEALSLRRGLADLFDQAMDEHDLCVYVYIYILCNYIHILYYIYIFLKYVCIYV